MPPRTVTVDRLAVGAELQRVVDQVRDGAVEHRPPALDRAGTLDVDHDLLAGPAAEPRATSSATSASAHRLDRLLAAHVGGQLDHLAHQVGELVELEPGLGDELRALARRRASWRAPRKSMLVRTAVSGVRSSWLASTTRRCCCSREVSSAISIVLKLAASRPTSSLPRTGIGVVRSWVAAMCSAVSVSRSMGSGGAPHHQPRRQRGQRDPGERDQHQAVAQHVEHVVALRHRPGDLHRAAAFRNDAVIMRYSLRRRR